MTVQARIAPFEFLKQVAVFRGPDPAAVLGVVAVHSTKPYIMLKDPRATVVIRRTDVVGEPLLSKILLL